VRNNDSSLLPP